MTGSADYRACRGSFEKELFIEGREEGMKLAEFPRGTKITICSSKENSYHEYQTEIIAAKDSLILAKPIMIEGRMVRFANETAKHVINVSENKKAYVYQEVEIYMAKLPTKGNQSAICIQTQEDAKPVNRRDFFRVFLGVDGQMKSGKTTRTEEVVIKDVSASGLGVLCDGAVHVPLESTVVVTFIDELTGETFALECMVVRRKEQSENKVLYGCKLPKPSNEMEKFVARRQRGH